MTLNRRPIRIYQMALLKSWILMLRWSQSRYLLVQRHSSFSTQARLKCHLLIRRFPRGHPDSFKTVRDLGLVSPGCPGESVTSGGCSFVWLQRGSHWLNAWHLGARVLVVAMLTARTVQGMARVRSGRARPGPRSLAGVPAGLQDQACLRVYVDRDVSTGSRCPAATVALEAGGAGTDNKRAIPDLRPGQRFQGGLS